MSKRRTRSQKIIASLKRKLKQKPATENIVKEQSDKPTISIKTIIDKSISPTKPKIIYQQSSQNLLQSPKLIKKDLIKTVSLSLFFFFLIIFIKLFFHL